MRQRLRSHLKFANVVSLIALFVALGGSAVASHESIFSTDIVDGQVKSADIGDDQVRSIDIRNDAAPGGGLAAPDLGPNSVGVHEINPDAFSPNDISPAIEGGPYEIPANAIQGHEVSPDTLGGSDINERSLSVANLGCQAGLILGFARIKGDSSMPSTYTSSSTYVDTKRNCSGGTVEVRRSTTGVYEIRFNGLATQLALGGAIDGGDTFCTDNFVSVTKLAGYTTASEFWVYSRDNDGDLQDCWVTVAAI